MDQKVNLYLNRNWHFWIHYHDEGNDYTKMRKSIHSDKPILTVQEFWRYFNYLPKPSLILKNKIKSYLIKGISLFDSTASPDWEIEKHKYGIIITFKIDQLELCIDELWLQLCIFIIGENSKHSDFCSGIKFIIHKNICLRYELWISCNEKDIANYYENEIKNIFSTLKFIKPFVHYQLHNSKNLELSAKIKLKTQTKFIKK